jgi:hypothetical protein
MLFGKYISTARNSLLPAAQHEWITSFDPDDGDIRRLGNIGK